MDIWVVANSSCYSGCQLGDDLTLRIIKPSDSIMKLRRKPDLFAVLAIAVGLGVIASGFAQGILNSSEEKAAQVISSNHLSQSAYLSERRP
jgi:hypothetical protein